MSNTTETTAPETASTRRPGNTQTHLVALSAGAALVLLVLGFWVLSSTGEVTAALAIVAAAVTCGTGAYVLAYGVEFTHRRAIHGADTPALGDSLLLDWVLAHKQAVALAAVLLLALVVRVADLGGTPANVTADETDDIQNAFRVIYSEAGGAFGLDWNQAPNFNMYLKAATISVFGESIAATRMYSVVLSMATLALFFPLARRHLDFLPALLATLLLATSLWFLVFSRTPWVAMSSALAATAAAYVLSLALEKDKLWLYALLGTIVAFGAYGYFAGRTLVFALAACYFMALFLKDSDFRSLTRGFALAGVVSLVLFAPQAKTLLDNWEYANTRPRAISIFSVEGEYLGDRGTAKIIVNQTLRTARGFLLLDKSVVNYGLWERQHPLHWAFLDQITGLLYWAGLVAAVYRWRTYAYWFAFLLIPAFVTQVFSTGTPDASRGLMVAPFMFLFVGVGLQTLVAWLTPRFGFRWVGSAAVALALALAVFNVSSYFSWTNSDSALAAREPAVQPTEYAMFLALAKERARQGRILSGEELDAIRNTAPAIGDGNDERSEAPTVSTGLHDEERLRDLEELAAALEAHRKQSGSYPSTSNNIQSACRYKAIDKLCFLESQVGTDAFIDPRGDQQRYGYWYKSDGQTYALFASMESPVDEAHTCPPEGHLQAEDVKNVLCLRSP